MSVTEQRYFRKGFKMRGDVQHLLDRDYPAELTEMLKARALKRPEAC